MAFDSTIRVRQMNQSDLSGFVIPIILNYLTGTGSLTGTFYPLKQNPSGYLQSGAFISQVDLDSAVAQTLNLISELYYPLSNPSGYLTAADVTHVTTAFSVNCTSGATTQYVSFPLIFTGIPTVNCSFVNNYDQNLYYFGVSGVNTSGFYVNYSDTIATTGYKLGVIADL